MLALAPSYPYQAARTDNNVNIKQVFPTYKSVKFLIIHPTPPPPLILSQTPYTYPPPPTTIFDPATSVIQLGHFAV